MIYVGGPLLQQWCQSSKILAVEYFMIADFFKEMESFFFCFYVGAKMYLLT